MFCSKCGAAIAADSAFCTVCGAPQVRADLPASASSAAAPITVGPNVGVAGYSAARGQLVYGEFWPRLVAFVVDSIVMGIASIVIFIPLVAITGAAAGVHHLEGMGRNGRLDPAAVAAIISAILTFMGAALLATWLYHAYFESSSWQATPGKRMMNLYITDLSGQPISFLNATGRHFAKIITNLIPLWLGYIMAAFTERRQALHDMIAGTLVLRR